MSKKVRLVVLLIALFSTFIVNVWAYDVPTKPTVEISSEATPTEYGWYNAPITVSASGSTIGGSTENVVYKYSYNDPPKTLLSMDNGIKSFLNDKDKTIYVRAYNSEATDNSVYSEYKAVDIKIDKVAPVISNVNEDINIKNRITIIAEDPEGDDKVYSGIDKYCYSTSSDSCTNWVSNQTITIPEIGNYYAYVKDKAGNIDKTSFSIVEITVLNAPSAPVITALDGVDSGEWHITDTILNYESALDGLGGIYYYCGTDSSVLSECFGSYDADYETYGTALYIKACNSYDETLCSDTSSYIIRSDKTKPMVTWVGLDDTLENTYTIDGEDPEVSGMSSGITEYCFSTSNETCTEWSNDYAKVLITPGKYYAFIKDLAGNISDGFEFDIEKTELNPIITVAPKVYDGTTSIELNTISVTGLSDGEYTIESAVLLDPNAGERTANVVIKLSNDNYTFDNNEQSKSFEVDVTVTRQEIAKPTKVNKTYTYTGEAQELELNGFDSMKMTITNNVRTNAGIQYAIISLKNSNYKWNDNTVNNIGLIFEIEKANLDVQDNTTNVSYVYDGNPYSINLNINNNNNNYNIRFRDNNGEYTLTTAPSYINPGIYNVRYKVYLDDNYTEYYGSRTITINEDTVNYDIGEYEVDSNNMYINRIPINSTVSDFKSNITLGTGYTVEVDSKIVNDRQVLYTGGKTRIMYNSVLFAEYTNIVSGDTDGNGNVTYLDYVKVYNHIQKTKNPNSNKTLLLGEYLLAADMNNDGKISYVDYVNIYNKIKELKGGTN